MLIVSVIKCFVLGILTLGVLLSYCLVISSLQSWTLKNVWPNHSI